MDSSIDKLASLPLEERIKLVTEDVSSKKDEFRDVQSHELAELLGIEDADQPGGDWFFIKYLTAEDVEGFKTSRYPRDEMIYLLEGKIPDERYKELLSLAETVEGGDSKFGIDIFITEEDEIIIKVNIDVLTMEEDEIIKDKIREQLLEELNDSMRVIAHNLSEEGLTFEAIIEDDGTCLELKTPYDQRDGLFVNLDNCLTESW